MAPRKKRNGTPSTSSATVGYEAELVDCMVALPGQLFYSTQNRTCGYTENANFGASKET